MGDHNQLITIGNKIVQSLAAAFDTLCEKAQGGDIVAIETLKKYNDELRQDRIINQMDDDEFAD